MVVRVLITALCAATLLWGSAAVAAPVQEAQQAVERLERQRGQLVAERSRVATRYRGQVAQLAKVRRERSSWGRDRRLRTLRAEAKQTSQRLTRLDEQLREVDAWLRRARQQLVKAVDKELAAPAGVSAARRVRLVKLRGQTLARLGHKLRKIVLPRHTIDPLADADELEEQRALLARTERELAREEAQLARREQRYRKMAALQQHRRRLDEADVFDEQPRRSVAVGSDSSSGSGNESPPADTAEPDPGSPGGSGFSGDGDDGNGYGGADPAVVLADVVDQDTLAAMKRAERSDDPRAKADAAGRARAQVQRKREQLERVRGQIDLRIRKLRGR